ncbi:MAG: alpha-glucosidase/alpha-galactosidase [Trueperaceae bacterium]
MAKITFIGAGSTVFAKNLIGDILSLPELADSTITLFDIDPKRLELSVAVGRRIAELLGVTPKIETTTDREKALDGADYAINMIQVGGYRPATVTDFEIPKKYGLRQTIGDTLGIGGIMRAVRTVPVLLEMQRDMERLCPDVVHLSYVNPMAINVWALRRASPIKTYGLCHSVQGTARELSRDVGVAVGDTRYLVAGINHMAFFLKFERDGEDLYPRVRAVIDEGRVPDWNRVRYELFARLGYFVTESSEHLSEYLPWFIKSGRPDLLERFNIPLDEYPGRCQIYELSWPFIEEELRRPGAHHPEELRQAVGDQGIEVMPRQIDHLVSSYEGLSKVRESGEYGSRIIHSIETGTPRTVYANVPNQGLIDNLPAECCVEVPCLVDGNGVQPTRVGRLPQQLAALMQTNINVQSLTVEGILSGDHRHIYHAAMLDPHTGAELTLDETWSMVDELLAAHGEFIPENIRESWRGRA